LLATPSGIRFCAFLCASPDFGVRFS